MDQPTFAKQFTYNSSIGGMYTYRVHYVSDFAFLLRFVRGKKYSQLLAREQIASYWIARSKSPELFQNIDPFDKTIIEVLKSG